MKGFRRLVNDIWEIKAAILFLVIYACVVFPIFHCFCPMVVLFGYPCPACGLSRACAAVLTGQFHRAAEENAMIFFWLPYILWLVAHQYFMGRKPKLMRALNITGGILTLAYYVWRIVNGTLIDVDDAGIISRMMPGK